MWAGIQTAVEMIYPPRCVGCGELVTSDFGLCGPCWRDTPLITGTICESCGLPLPGEVDGHRIECDDCMQMPRPWQDGRAALTYTGRARKMILALKHGDRPDLARPAARWMVQAAGRMLQPGRLVIPVPLHWSRLLRRRYNQSALLATHVAGLKDLPTCPDMLLRSQATPKLDGKCREERTSLLTNAIRVNPRHAAGLAERDVVLVDDVMTSGATLTACAEACLCAGADHIFVLTLARVAKDA
ncbi:double zinc ribbon domain-containing protein [Ruegeria hyattellae]|uniref:double zinc ribbon domain-containing protein n=1 Tax=Ruegeria hyattellae TaxID=3233337 RepID=UPI00355C4258